MKTQNFLKGSVILLISAILTKGLGALFKIPLTYQLGGVGMGYFGCAYGLFLPVYALSITGLSTARCLPCCKRVWCVSIPQRPKNPPHSTAGLYLYRTAAECRHLAAGRTVRLLHSCRSAGCLAVQMMAQRLFWMPDCCRTGLLRRTL